MPQSPVRGPALGFGVGPARPRSCSACAREACLAANTHSHTAHRLPGLHRPALQHPSSTASPPSPQPHTRRCTQAPMHSDTRGHDTDTLIHKHARTCTCTGVDAHTPGSNPQTPRTHRRTQDTHAQTSTDSRQPTRPAGLYPLYSQTPSHTAAAQHPRNNLPTHDRQSPTDMHTQAHMQQHTALISTLSIPTRHSPSTGKPLPTSSQATSPHAQLPRQQSPHSPHSQAHATHRHRQPSSRSGRLLHRTHRRSIELRSGQALCNSVSCGGTAQQHTQTSVCRGPGTARTRAPGTQPGHTDTDTQTRTQTLPVQPPQTCTRTHACCSLPRTHAGARNMHI